MCSPFGGYPPVPPTLPAATQVLEERLRNAAQPPRPPAGRSAIPDSGVGVPAQLVFPFIFGA